MIDSFAKLLSDVLQSLGYPPKDMLEVEDAARAVRDRLALRGLHLSQSGERLNVSHKDFTPTSGQREKDLSGLVAGVPLWLERKEGVEPNESWPFVTATNLATLEEARERGEERCAFYKEGGKLKVRLSDTPDGSTIYRVRYSPSLLDVQTLADALPVPEELAPFIAAEAGLDLIPGIMRKLSADAENPPSRELIAAWGATASGLNRIASDWLPLWNQRRLRGPGSARSRNRRSVLAQ